MDLGSVLPVPDRVSSHAKTLFLGGMLNGFGNGIFNVVMQLYLMSFGFNSATIGTIGMMNSIGAALLTLPAGILADRYGKGKIVLLGLPLMVLAMMLALIARSVEGFFVAFLLLGLNNGIGSLWGPLYSMFFDKEDLDKAYALWGFINILSSSLGSLLGFIPPMLVSNYGYSQQASYWTLLVIGVGFFFASIPFWIISVRGVVEPKNNGGSGFKFSLKSKGVVAKFSLLVFVTNIGFGAFFSLFPYYVNKKFGVKSDALGALYFASNFILAGANAVAPRISKRLGALKTIVAAHVLSIPFWLMFPLAPSFTWLSLFYVVRSGMKNISSPIISSLFYKMLYEEEKGTANSIYSMMSMGGNIIAPRLGGQLMEQFSLDFPVYLGSGIYAAVAASYYFLLRNEKEAAEQ